MSDHPTVRKPLCARLSIAVQGDRGAIRIDGRANANSTTRFRRVMERIRKEGATHVFLFLESCKLMDSTFLGVLARFGVEADREKTGLRISLVLPTPHVRRTIENLGVLDCFDLPGKKPATPFEFHEPDEEDDSDHLQMLETSLEAHQTLIHINPENESRFAGVTSLLSRDLERYRRKKDAPDS